MTLPYSPKDRRACYRKLRRAMRLGIVVRPDKCSHCERSCSPDAHHDDYSRPLAVRWLCRRCHAFGHMSIKRFVGKSTAEAA